MQVWYLCPWVRKIPWRRKWQSNPVFLPGESHGQRSLMGYSPWGHRVGHDWATEYTHCTKHIVTLAYFLSVSLWLSVQLFCPFSQRCFTSLSSESSQSFLNTFYQCVANIFSQLIILSFDFLSNVLNFHKAQFNPLFVYGSYFCILRNLFITQGYQAYLAYSTSYKCRI